MNNLLNLIKIEIIFQNKINNVGKYIFSFILFSIFSLSMIVDQTQIKTFGSILFIILLPISLLGFANILFKQDVNDGHLENLLSVFTPMTIVLSKFFAFLINAATPIGLNIIIIFFLFDMELKNFIYFVLSIFLLIILTNALLILSSIMQSYFRSNSNFLSIIILPMIIPNIIISGLIMQNPSKASLLLVMSGIDLILIPISIFLTSYLTENIYNI